MSRFLSAPQTPARAPRALDVGVGYWVDVDRVIAVPRALIGGVAAAPAWAPRLTGQGELLRRIKSTFEREGIEMPYPQRVVHLVNEQAAT